MSAVLGAPNALSRASTAFGVSVVQLSLPTVAMSPLPGLINPSLAQTSLAQTAANVLNGLDGFGVATVLLGVVAALAVLVACVLLARCCLGERRQAREQLLRGSGKVEIDISRLGITDRSKGQGSARLWAGEEGGRAGSGKADGRERRATAQEREGRAKGSSNAALRLATTEYVSTKL